MEINVLFEDTWLWCTEKCRNHGGDDGALCWNLSFWIWGKDVYKHNFLKLMSGEVLDAVEVSLALFRFPGVGENYCATEAWSWRSPQYGRSQTLEQSCTQQRPAEIAYWKQEEKPFSCNVSQVASSAKFNLYQQTKIIYRAHPYFLTASSEGWICKEIDWWLARYCENKQK